MTLFIQSKRNSYKKEVRKERFYLTTHSTHLVTVIWRWSYKNIPGRFLLILTVYATATSSMIKSRNNSTLKDFRTVNDGIP